MRLIWVLSGAALLALVLGEASAGPSYIGAVRCKLCHRDVYDSWAKTPHARATDSVSGEEHCLGCHATAGRDFGQVQCEACHGPGSNYSLPEVMIDPEKAAMAGLVSQSIVVCERCHGSKETGHRREFVMPEPSEWAKWIHERKNHD